MGRQPAGEDGADDGGGGARSLPQVERALPAATNPPRAGGSTENLWGYPRPVYRPAAFVRVRRLPARSKLSLPRGLRGQREAESRDNLSPTRIQDQIPWELFPSQRKPRMRFDQSDLRI